MLYDARRNEFWRGQILFHPLWSWSNQTRDMKKPQGWATNWIVYVKGYAHTVAQSRRFSSWSFGCTANSRPRFFRAAFAAKWLVPPALSVRAQPGRASPPTAKISGGLNTRHANTPTTEKIYRCKCSTDRDGRKNIPTYLPTCKHVHPLCVGADTEEVRWAGRWLDTKIRLQRVWQVKTYTPCGGPGGVLPRHRFHPFFNF